MSRDRTSAPGSRSRDAVLTHDTALAWAFDLLAKRWNGAILIALLRRPAGFADLERAVPAINPSMLSKRLAELRRAGILERHVASGPPVRVEYRLTTAGLSLRGPLMELASWANSIRPSTGSSSPAPTRAAAPTRPATSGVASCECDPSHRSQRGREARRGG
jgi:DNA-binding HxlR family transcriptional regulator